MGRDAEIRQFANTSVARFSLAVGRTEKSGDESTRISAFMNIEAWRKNEKSESFDTLTKGSLITVEGHFKPEEWTDADGVKHNRVILVATGSGERNRKRRNRRRRAKPSLPLTLLESDLRAAFLLLAPDSDSYRQNLIYICKVIVAFMLAFDLPGLLLLTFNSKAYGFQAVLLV